MSSILKALKKLEEEKAARKGGPVNIATDILQSNRRKKQKITWLVTAGMGIVAAVAVLVTYTSMGGFSSRRQDNKPVVAVSPPPRESVVPPATPPSPPAKTTGGETVPPPKPVEGAKTATLTGTSPRAAAIRTSPPTPPPLTEEAPPVSPPPQQAIPTGEKNGGALQRPSSGPLPVLNVSGIAWQKDGASRLAVVNSMSVSQGATIEGARVEEILPDRVRFSIGDRTFEIPLGNGHGEKK